MAADKILQDTATQEKQVDELLKSIHPTIRQFVKPHLLPKSPVLVEDAVTRWSYADRCATITPILTYLLALTKRGETSLDPLKLAIPSVIEEWRKVCGALLEDVPRDVRIDAERVARLAIGLNDAAKQSVAMMRAQDRTADYLEHAPFVEPSDEDDYERYTSQLTSQVVTQFLAALGDARRI